MEPKKETKMSPMEFANAIAKMVENHHHDAKKKMLLDQVTEEASEVDGKKKPKMEVEYEEEA